MGAELFHADRRTDTAKLIFAFRSSRTCLKTSRREVTKDIFQGKLCPCIKDVFLLCKWFTDCGDKFVRSLSNTVKWLSVKDTTFPYNIPAYLLTYLFTDLLSYLVTFIYLHSYLLSYLITYFLTYLLTHSLTYLVTYLFTDLLWYLLSHLLT
jgi:hypothetical protein